MRRHARTGLLLAAGLLWLGTGAMAGEDAADAKARANITGVVQDSYGDAVAGARIEALDESGSVVAEATTSSAGGYELDCLPEGDYRLRLEPGSAAYQGQTVHAPLDARGLRVNWSVSKDKAAIAKATPNGGSCAEAVAGAAAPGAAGAAAGVGAIAGSPAAIAGGAAVVVGGTLGGLAASGAFDSSGGGGAATAATPSR